MLLAINFQENFFYHWLAFFESDDPACVYNPEYYKNRAVHWSFSDTLRQFVRQNVAMLSHFPFFDEQGVQNLFNHSFNTYTHYFLNAGHIQEDFGKVMEEINAFFHSQRDAYTRYYDQIDKAKLIDNFTQLYLAYVQEAIRLAQQWTGIILPDAFVIHFIETIPLSRGKSIAYAGKTGIAVGIPALGAVFNVEYLHVVLHELMHHFSDQWLLSHGFAAPKENSGDAYIVREACAEGLNRMVFESFLLPRKESFQLESVPEAFRQALIVRLDKVPAGIDYFHLGTTSQSTIVDLTEKNYVLQPNLAILGELQGWVILFSPILGRLYRVPRYFIDSLSPLRLCAAYFEHYKLSHLLVPKGYSVPIQTTGNTPANVKCFHRLRLHMTEDCNLRCTYCYLSAGQRKNSMSFEIAKAAIDALGDKNKDAFEIEFHGGGEPTLAIQVIKKTVNYARKVLLNPVFRIQSNGLFPKKEANYFIKEKFIVTISLDGPQFIHDLQRPGNANSFKQTTATISYLIDKEYPVMSISVISKDSLPHLLEIYTFIRDLGVRSMMFNPIHELGRAAQSLDSQSVDPMEFAKSFLVVLELAEKDGVALVSDFFGDITGNYLPRNFQCDACRPSATVHYNGDLCACTRAYDIADVPANPFVWGHVREGKLEYDREKVSRLTSRVSENIAQCQACLLKYNCAGDCLVALYKGAGDINMVMPERCEAKRFFAAQYLLRKARQIFFSES